MNTPTIRIVTGTRLTFQNFVENSLLGKSLTSYKPNNVEVKIYTENSLGLSEIYNKEIEQAKLEPAILVFIHDDVMLLDHYWSYHLIEGLEKFDIVGIAGSKRRTPYQPSWLHVGSKGETLQWDDEEFLSGLVAHDENWPPKIMSYYGKPNQQVIQLDGVFLAANSETLIKNDIRFDPQFKFHFYDLDFSRTCDNKGLKLGTVPIAICHGGKGKMNTIDFKNMYNLYHKKWEINTL
jgi:GT2 family glycosyltransferase